MDSKRMSSPNKRNSEMPPSDHHHREESKHHRVSSTEPTRYAVAEAPAGGSEVYEVDEDDDDVPEVRRHWATSAFEEKSRRMAFVRKTLGTVLLQLLVCAAITAGCIFSPKDVKGWMQEHWYIGLIGGLLFFIISIAVGCCGVGRGPPSCCNISLLIFGTLCLTTLCAFITVIHDNLNVVVYALAATVLILLIIVLVTLCTPIDITGCGIFLLCAGLVLIIASFIAGIFFLVSENRETMRIVFLVISILFILLLTMYILYDLQLIVGGRRHEMDEDDWLYACLMLFGDIVHLFLQLLQCFGLIPRTN